MPSQVEVVSWLAGLGSASRSAFVVAAWIAAIGFLLSGLQDRFYDLSRIGWQVYRRFKFRGRRRVSLERLRAMEPQRIAVMVPAWSEADVIEKMLANILERVEYASYVVFVGTYPNDPATQAAVDRVAAQHPRVVKVVTSRPGPTSKSDCLNNIVAAIERYEAANDVRFEIVAMHDAEDFVHPSEFLLFNYLLPRVDAIQIPILPMPTPHSEVVHWSYADEFALNHMNDIIAREHTSGFVPFAGTGMAFSRRALRVMQARIGAKLFQDGALTEDYSMGKKMHDAGLTVVFVNVTLADDDAPFWVPLCKRPHFVSNWAFFPKTFERSVRQKTRWITGIAIQEWQQAGWKGSLLTRQDLVKDRKGLFTPYVVLLGYAVLGYEVVAWLGVAGAVPFRWEPLLAGAASLQAIAGANLALLLCTVALRVGLVTRVYGITAGLLSVPRFVVSNVVAMFAATRALEGFAKARLRKGEVKWDKTAHDEGIGALPAEVERAHEASLPPADVAAISAGLRADTGDRVAEALQAIADEGEIPASEREGLIARAEDLVTHVDYRVRAALARALLRGRSTRRELLFGLLGDRDWAVRANTARAIARSPDAAAIVVASLDEADRYGRQVLLRTVENDVTLSAAVTDAAIVAGRHNSPEGLLFGQHSDRGTLRPEAIVFADEPSYDGRPSHTRLVAEADALSRTGDAS